MRRLWFVVAAAVLLVSACGGTSSGDVTITWTYDFVGEPWQGPVALAGSAVDDGVVCPEGEAIERSFNETSLESDSAAFRTVLAITCSDGSGDFEIQEDIEITMENGEFTEDFEVLSAVWTVLSGTGDYTELEGGGEGGEGSDDPDSGLTVNVYTGELSNS